MIGKEGMEGSASRCSADLQQHLEPLTAAVEYTSRKSKVYNRVEFERNATITRPTQIDDSTNSLDRKSQVGAGQVS